MDAAAPPQPCASVVVPVRDGASQLPRLLDALGRQAAVAPFEVVVVDNRSRDATRAVAHSHPVVTRVITEQAPGSYAARNAGVASSSAPIVAFVDVDCAPEPGWLGAGLAALERADLVGGAIHQLRSADPSAWEVYDRATYLDQEELITTQRFAATANLFVHRRVFDAVGGFDAALQSSGDLDFGNRAVAAGYRLGYAPDAVVEHTPRTTLGGTWRLHRRLGAGWATLARRGARPPAWRDDAMRMRLTWVAHAVAQGGDPLRRRQLVPVHAVALAARWTGWLRTWAMPFGRRPRQRSTASRSR